MLKTKSRARARRRPTPASRLRPAPHPNTKVVRRAEKVFAEMGMTPAEAVALFYKQTALHRDFPITELIPNERTRAGFREARAGIGIVKYGSLAEMRADLLKDA